MPARTQKPVSTGKSDKSRTLIIAICLFVILAMAIVFAINLFAINSMSANTQRSEKPIVTIENVFVDVNGDGLVDLIVYAEIILNQSPANFIQGQ